MWLGLGLVLGLVGGVSGVEEEEAAFHRSVSSEALRWLGGELAERDEACSGDLTAAGLLGPDRQALPWIDKAAICLWPAEWGQVEAALQEVLAWVAAGPPPTSRLATLPGPGGAGDWAADLRRLAALSGSLVERGDDGPARKHLAFLLRSLQSLARLRVQHPHKASLVLQNLPHLRAWFGAVEGDERRAALQVSKTALLEMAMTRKLAWDVSKNYSSSLWDSRMLGVLGAGGGGLGMILDADCEGAETAERLETLLTGVLEAGLQWEMEGRGRVWVLRTKPSARVGFVALTSFPIVPEPEQGPGLVAARIRLFIRDVCDGGAQDKLFKPDVGLATFLNSIPEGRPVFAIVDLATGMLPAAQHLPTLELLVSARRLRLDVLALGAAAASAHLDSAGENLRQLMMVVKSFGGLLVPVTESGEVPLRLLGAMADGPLDRRLAHHGPLRGSALLGAEAGAETELLLHCPAPTDVLLDGQPRSLAFLHLRLSDLRDTLISAPRAANCYLQVFSAAAALPTPVLSISDAEGPVVARSLPQQPITLGLSWPSQPSQCSFSWSLTPDKTMEASSDCKTVEVPSLPEEASFLQVRAWVGGVRIQRVIPRLLVQGWKDSPRTVPLSMESGEALVLPDPVFGLPFDRALPMYRMAEAGAEGETRSVVLTECRANDSYLLGSAVATAAGPRPLFLPTASIHCTQPNSVQSLCLVRSGASEGGRRRSWWVCEWVPRSVPAPSAEAVPAVSGAAQSLASAQAPAFVCDGRGPCAERKWYLELRAPRAQRLQFSVWPPNASSQMAEVRMVDGLVKLEGWCCVRNVSLFLLSQTASLSSALSFVVWADFNAFPPDQWPLFKILFVAFIPLLGGVLLLLCLVSCAKRLGRRRRLGRQARAANGPVLFTEPPRNLSPPHAHKPPTGFIVTKI